MTWRGAVLVIAGLTVHVAGLTQTTAREYYEQGSRAFVEKRFDQAIDALKRSLVIDPGQLRTARLLGLSYQLAGRLDEAESQFQAATRLSPKDAEAWFYLGRVYYIRNFFDKALASLETAVKYAPGDARILECLALTHEATGEFAAAEAEYRRAMAASSKQPESLPMNYGALLLKLNRPAESEPLLRRAAGGMPASWQARFELAKLYCQTERFEAALSELKAALQVAAEGDEAARTHGLMAVAYSRLGRHEEARMAAEAAEK